MSDRLADLIAHHASRYAKRDAPLSPAVMATIEGAAAECARRLVATDQAEIARGARTICNDTGEVDHAWRTIMLRRALPSFPAVERAPRADVITALRRALSHMRKLRGGPFADRTRETTIRQVLAAELDASRERRDHGRIFIAAAVALAAGMGA